VASVVRLGLQARRDEIEIMELVGAPMAFIRGPFVAEGTDAGRDGRALRAARADRWILRGRAWWGRALEQAFAGSTLEFLPIRLCLLSWPAGMVVGSAGGFVGVPSRRFHKCDLALTDASAHG
jgi:cell division protein FtsX